MAQEELRSLLGFESVDGTPFRVEQSSSLANGFSDEPSLPMPDRPLTLEDARRSTSEDRMAAYQLVSLERMGQGGSKLNVTFDPETGFWDTSKLKPEDKRDFLLTIAQVYRDRVIAERQALLQQRNNMREETTQRVHGDDESYEQTEPTQKLRLGKRVAVFVLSAVLAVPTTGAIAGAASEVLQRQPHESVPSAAVSGGGRGMVDALTAIPDFIASIHK